MRATPVRSTVVTTTGTGNPVDSAEANDVVINVDVCIAE